MTLFNTTLLNTTLLKTISLKASTLIAHLLIQILGIVPISIRRALGKTFGKVICRFAKRERTIAELQLQAFFTSTSTTTPDTPSQITSEMFAHFGALILEAANLFPYLRNSEQSISCPDFETIRSLRDSKQPVIALTAHTGNWELMAAYMAQLEVPVVTIGRRVRNPILHSLMATLRERYRVKTVWRGGVAGQRELVDTLKNGGVLAALIDQDTYVSGKPSVFFGTPVSTPSALIELGKRHNASFVTAFNFRQEDDTFLIRVEPVSKELSSQEIIDLYNERLEGYIRQFPSQWVWFHKRWRTDSNGRKLSSSEYKEFLRARLQPNFS